MLFFDSLSVIGLTFYLPFTLSTLGYSLVYYINKDLAIKSIARKITLSVFLIIIVTTLIFFIVSITYALDIPLNYELYLYYIKIIRLIYIVISLSYIFCLFISTS